MYNKKTMYYCVVHYPNIDSTKIETLRQKYDPTANYIKAHLTLVFPVKTDSVNKDDLVSHVKDIVTGQAAFKMKLAGFEKSWDNWLFLGVEDGKDKVVSLHDELYSGILEPHWRKDLPFSPHLSLGQFNLEGSNYSLKNPEAVAFNSEAYEQALKEAKEAGLNYETTVDRLTLIKLDDNLTEILESQDFSFEK